MSDLSAKSFLDLVQRSGIVEPDRLKSALAELSKQAAGRAVKLDELTQFLIKEGLITSWHYEKLITGKYKGFFIGQYKLLSLLGSGGMSSVYLAEHRLSGHNRAIKVLPRRKVDDKSYLDRFYREGRAAASLNHSNIVRIYDLGVENELHFMVMEYVKGVDLFQKVRDTGPVAPRAALDYLRQAAEALSHAHARNIVHRDIKPANLLLADDNSVKILDLGLALLRDEDQSLTLLHNEKVMGTADYLAPEQAVNSHEVDHRADIYSLGGTFYFLLTGSPPFPEGTIAQRIAMHQTREPKPILELRPDCPPILQALCSKMMKKNPAERIQNCGQLIQAIEQCRAVMDKAGADATQAVALPKTQSKETASIPSASKQVPSRSDPGKPTLAKTPLNPVHAPPVSKPTPAASKQATRPAANAAQPIVPPRPPVQPSLPQTTPAPATSNPTVGSNLAAAQEPLPKRSNESPVVTAQTGQLGNFAAESVPTLEHGRISFDASQVATQLPTPGQKSRRAAKASQRNNLVISGIVLVGFALLIGLVFVIFWLVS